MPNLIHPAPYYPTDPAQSPYDFYNKIAEDTITRRDETGALHTFVFEVAAFLPNSNETYDDPLGLTGDIIYKVGADGNAIDKVINPTQIQFRLRSGSRLLERMRGANKRDFQLKITENGQVIFRGYLLLKTKKHSFYQSTPEVQLRAYDGLALLNELPVSNFPLDYSSEPYITVKEFLAEMERQMGIALGWVVHSNFNDPAGDSHFPLDYQFKLGQMLRGVDADKRTWGTALELFARNHFGMQVYQWKGRWHMIGRAERVTNPQAITTIDMDSQAVSTEDFTGPALDQSNAILRPNAEVIGGLAEVRGELQLGDGFLRNEALGFDSTGQVPYWDTNDISEVQSATTFDQVLRFNTPGSSSVSQLTKTVLEAHDNPAPVYETRFTVSVEVEIITKNQPAGTDEVALNVDLFQLQTVDPRAVVDDETVYARLFDGAKPANDTDKVYYNSITIPGGDESWFSVRVDKKRDGQAGYLSPAISASASFKCALQIPGSADDLRRYLRILFQPHASADQNGGNGELLDKVNLVSVKISRDDPSSRKESIGQRQPTSAPNYSQRTDRFTGKNQGKSLTLKTSLSNFDTYNGLYLFKAPQGGSLARVENLARTGLAFPYATTRARMAMQAVDLERVSLRTRHALGTSPLQSLSFVVDDTTTMRIIPIAWKRVLTTGMVSITAAEARFDEAAIDEQTIYGPVDAGGGGDEFGSSSASGGSIARGGGSGSGITDHGHLDGLDDDDHKQYLNEERGDARYYTEQESDDRFLNEAQNLADLPDAGAARVSLGLGPGDTPALGQVLLNNPASAAHHAVRAGKQISTSQPLTGGGSLLDTIDISLKYNAKNLRVGAYAQLNTIQDIDTDAEMTLKTLLLKQGLTLNDLLGYVQSETFVGDFAGSGVQLRKENGKWRLTVDDLTVRNQFKVFEILVQQIQAGAEFLLTEGHRVDSVEPVGEPDISWDSATEAWTDSTATWTPTWRCYIPEDMLLQFAVGDLIKRQQFSGRNVGVTNATVIATEPGSITPTDNTPRRSFTIYIEPDGSQPPEAAFAFARLGNRTDRDRQGGIIMTSSDDGAPYQRTFNGVDSFDKFGAIETIKSQSGRLDNLVHPDFAELDGTQKNLYGDLLNNIFARGKIVITGGEGVSNLDDAGLLAELDNLDEVPDGVQYGKTARTAITGDGLIQLSEVIGNADDIVEGAQKKFAAESGADVTAGNPQGQGWLSDGASLINENDTITKLTGRVLDNIADGNAYSRVRSAQLVDGVLQLSEAAGVVGDLADGGGYSKVKSSQLSAGKLLLSEALGNLGDLADGGGYSKVKSLALTASGLVQMSEVSGNADDIVEGAQKKFAAESGADVTAGNPQGQGWLSDGASLINENDTITKLTGRVLDNIADGNAYSRVRSAQLVDGVLQLSEAAGVVGDLADGGGYSKVKSSQLSAGKLLLSEALGNLGDLADGGGYSKVRSTAVSAGRILLSETAGTLDDVPEGGTENWNTSTEDWNSSTATWAGTYGRVRQTQLQAGYIQVKGPSGKTLIEGGVLDTEALFAEKGTFRGSLDVGNVLSADADANTGNLAGANFNQDSLYSLINGRKTELNWKDQFLKFYEDNGNIARATFENSDTLKTSSSVRDSTGTPNAPIDIVDYEVIKGAITARCTETSNGNYSARVKFQFYSGVWNTVDYKTVGASVPGVAETPVPFSYSGKQGYSQFRVIISAISGSWEIASYGARQLVSETVISNRGISALGSNFFIFDPIIKNLGQTLAIPQGQVFVEGDDNGNYTMKVKG